MTVVPEIPAGETVDVPVSVTVPAGTPADGYEVSVSTSVGRMQTTTVHDLAVVLPNVALGKPATQKSLAWDGLPSRAVDGNTDGNFGAGTTTHTAEPSDEAWWQVDLEGTFALDAIEIWNRTDCCADRLSDYWVMVSVSPISADSLDEARTAPGVTAIHQPGQVGRPTRVDLDDLPGRYVRVQLASHSNPLSLSEVKVRAR